MKVKLAEALLRRKELQEKVNQLRNIKDNQMIYEIRGQRNKITDGIDELNANYPKLEVNQVTQEYDFSARQLRLVDAAIQQTNWTCEMDIDPIIMEDYKSKK